MNQKPLIISKSKFLIIVLSLFDIILIVSIWYLAPCLIADKFLNYDSRPLLLVEREEKVIITLDKSEYQTGESIKISIKNNLGESIFLGGCNQYGLEAKENGQWEEEPPLKQCVWEGYGLKVNSKETANYSLDTQKEGTFRINVGYAKGCEDNKPVSQANCKADDIAYSAEFTVKEKSVAVGGELNFETILKGGYSEYCKSLEIENVVITSQVEWFQMLGKVGLEFSGVIAPVDFTKDMLIATFQCSRPTGGYSIEITKIVETGNNLEVYLKDISPGYGCIVTEALTSPYHIVKIQKSDKEVIFNIDKEVINCQQ